MQGCLKVSQPAALLDGEVSWPADEGLAGPPHAQRAPGGRPSSLTWQTDSFPAPPTGTERVTKAADSPIPCKLHSLLKAPKSVLIYPVWVQF